MATRRYMANPEEASYQVTEAAGAATASKRIELTVDWDTLASDGLSGQAARLAAINACYKFIEYIEQTGKVNVKA
jgi:hypothetical protein